jgi:hypothetical protein
VPVIGACSDTPSWARRRYAHLFDDPLRAATERAAAIVTGNGDGGEMVSIERGKRA